MKTFTDDNFKFDENCCMKFPFNLDKSIILSFSKDLSHRYFYLSWITVLGKSGFKLTTLRLLAVQSTTASFRKLKKKDQTYQ